MTRILVVAAAIAAITAQTPPPSTPVPPDPPKPAVSRPAGKPKTEPEPEPNKVAKWLRDTFGLDLQAYATLTGIRGDEEHRTGTRLVVYDMTSETESILWECGTCWSPVMVAESVAVLRMSDSPDQSSIWIVGACVTYRIGEALPAEAMLVGARDGAIYAAIPDGRCEPDDATHRLVAVDSRSGATIDLPEPLCVRPAALARADRVRDGRILATTPAQKAGGVIEPRRPYVLAPATSARPTATALTLPSDSIDRFDPIWGGTNRVIYVARPRGSE